MNRAQLKLAIAAWLHRATFRTPVANVFDVISGFIALAEQQINDALRARCMVVRAQQAIEGQYTPLPCDYLEMESARIINGPPLTYIDTYGAAEAIWLQSKARYAPIPVASNTPWPVWSNEVHFSISGAEMELSPYPTPDSSLPAGSVQLWPVAEMRYFRRQLLGPNDEDTNPVLQTYPGIYMFGALTESAPFLRDDERAPMWLKKFTDAVSAANEEYRRGKTQGSRLTQKFKRIG